MIDERTEELAALYALDLLEGAERTAFEAQLGRDAELQALVRELRETAAALALTAPAATPAPALKSRLLEKISTAGGSDRPATNILPFRLPALIPWAVAAGFAVAAAWLGQSLFTSREEAAALSTESRLAQLTLRDAENRLKAERIVLTRQIANSGQQLTDAQKQLADNARAMAAANQRLAVLTQQLKTEGDLAELKIATLASMLGNSPQALAVAVWNPARQEGVFAVEKLPVITTDQDYELWVLEDQQPTKPISGGVFTLDASGRVQVRFKPEAPVTKAAKFAVSIEKKGGAPRLSGPQGAVIVISQ